MEKIQLYDAIVSSLHSVTLPEMDRVKLMNRVDTKFIFHNSLLPDIFNEIRDQYSILEIDDKRVFCYDSLYLDTDDYCMYKQHHNGKPRRVKVRYRTYCHTGDVFFEIKQRRNPLRTHKYRIQVDHIPSSPGDEEQKLLHEHGIIFDQELTPKLLVGYKRVTLVAKDGIERVTIDIQLEFDNFLNHVSHEYLSVAEIKQERFSRMSPFVYALRKRNIKEHSISKYALGLIELQTDIKMNAFKSKVTYVEQIEKR